MSFTDNAYREIPERFFERNENGGEVVRITYEAADYVGGKGKYTKSAFVYLPRGYEDSTEKYNVLYLMHGGADNERWYFESENDYTPFRNMLDNMVAEGMMKPCIICTPTYMNPNSRSIPDSCKFFHRELLNEVIPAVEERFRCFAEDMSEETLRRTRMHRAFGGFSMGSVTTWWTFMSMLDKIAWYLPISGDSWCVEEKGGSTHAERTAELLAEAVRSSGLTAGDFYIYSGTGSEDIAYPNLTPQIEAMKRLTDVFTYCDSFDKGNLYFAVRENGYHDIHTVARIVYNGLPKFFR